MAQFCVSIDNDKSSDNTDFYRQNIENFNNFMEGLSKIFYDGFMYWYNSDLANKMRKDYENNYRQYLKTQEEFYNNLYKNYKP
jgi:hypothetical protein